AMPKLIDSEFSHAVIYLWEYGEQGASGVIINKPMNIYLGELLKQIKVKDMSWYTENYPVRYGGPVAPDQIFVIRRQQSRLKNQEGDPMSEITVSATRRDLIPLAVSNWRGNAIVTLGCSVWLPGQLDQELTDNDWLILPFNESTLFGT